MVEATATVATIGSRTFKTRKGAESEAARSFEYAHSGGCTLDVTEHDGGYVVLYFEDTGLDRAMRLVAAGQSLDLFR